MNKRFLIFLLSSTAVLFLSACGTLESFGQVPDVSQIQNQPFYSEVLATVALVQIPVIVVALLSLVVGWKVGRLGLAINGFVIGGVLLYTYLGGVGFIPDENFRLGLSITGAVITGLLAYFLFNLMALIIGGVIGLMLMNGAWLQVADKVPPQILVFISTFVSALVMFLVFRLFMVAFSAIIGAVILMIAVPLGTFWVIPVAAVGIAVQMVMAFLLKDDIFQNMKGDLRAALGQAFGDVLGPFGVLFEHQKEEKQSQKETKLAPEPRAPRQAKQQAPQQKQVTQQPYQAPQQVKQQQPRQPYQPQQAQPYQAPKQAPQPYQPQQAQQPYQAPKQAPPQQPYQPQQASYQTPKAPVPAIPPTQVNMPTSQAFRPENYYLQVSTGQTFALVGTQITVGRNPDNVIVLHDLQVSGTHLIFEIQADGVIVWDNNSTNGSLLNGQALTGWARLSPVDVVQAGDVTLRLMQRTP